MRVPSLEGWITTLESVERIAKLLFNEYNVEYFFPRNLNQDPLDFFLIESGQLIIKMSTQIHTHFVIRLNHY